MSDAPVVKTVEIELNPAHPAGRASVNVMNGDLHLVMEPGKVYTVTPYQAEAVLAALVINGLPLVQLHAKREEEEVTTKGDEHASTDSI